MKEELRSFDDVAKDCLKNIAGYYGTVRISGTDSLGVDIMGFKAIEDTVIAELRNQTHDLLEVTGYGSKTIAAGNEIFFGAVATNIKLTSGSGEGYRAIPLSLPSAPLLLGNPETAIDGTTIELNFSKEMIDPTAHADVFILKVDGEAVTVTSVEHGTPDSQLIITPATPIANGDVVTLSMESRYIASTDGARYAGVTDLPIKNTVPES